MCSVPFQEQLSRPDGLLLPGRGWESLSTNAPAAAARCARGPLGGPPPVPCTAVEGVEGDRALWEVVSVPELGRCTAEPFGKACRSEIPALSPAKPCAKGALAGGCP